VARGQAGPSPPLVIVKMTASVTPCRHPTGATVLDEHRHAHARGSAAGLGGDVGGTDQLPVPLEPAAGTAEPAARGLGDPPVAGGAGGGGATLIYQPHHHSGLFGLVAQGLEQVGAAPLPQAEVLHPAHIPVGDPPGVAHQPGPDPVLHGEGDDLLGSLVLGLVDAAAMPRLDLPQPGPMAAPAARPALPRLGCASGGLGLPDLLILEVQVGLGAECPARDQQPGVLGDDRLGVEDPQVHSCDSGRVQVVVLLDGDGGGDRQPQPPTLGQQRHGPQRLWWVGERAGQPHPQLGLASCDWQPHPLTLDPEGAVVEADRDQGALVAREPGPLMTAVLGGLEPGVAVAAQHRPCPSHRQLPERSHPGELAAQRLVASRRPLALLAELPVGVQQPRPHIPGRPQQPVAAAGLPAGGAQADCGGPVHQTRSSNSTSRNSLVPAHHLKQQSNRLSRLAIARSHVVGPATPRPLVGKGSAEADELPARDRLATASQAQYLPYRLHLRLP